LTFQVLKTWKVCILIMPWHSFHFQPLETQDVFLVRALRPFLQQYIWPQRGARAFFLRYQDENGPHLRIRFQADENWLQETLLPAWEGWMQDRGNRQPADYLPEIERFGGEESLALAEEHFHLSTRVVLDRIAREQFTYGDAMFDALRMNAIAVHAAGLKQDEAARYFARLTEQWLPLFFGGEDAADNDLNASVLAGFEKNLAPQRDELRQVITELWKALDKESFDKKQPEWARWALGNRMILPALGQQLDRALPSLLHLNNNRLGINNQDEVYLLFILSKII
jgi:thiopeptide-type bacteriocin biosynthesis protein